MLTLGILVTNLCQEEDYFTDLAKFGLNENVTTYLFLPTDIDRSNRTVRGMRYSPKSNSWQEDAFPLPTYIYDRCFYESEDIFQRHFSYVSWLKLQPDVCFLGHGLPNKWVVQNILKDDPMINLFLPETRLLATTNEVFSMFKRQSSLLFKPASGSQGKGIFILTNTGTSFTLNAKKAGVPFHKELSNKQVEQLLKKIATKRKYLFQPYLQLTSHERRPFDIRIFLQKNREGKWSEIGRGIRTGKIGDYTSNLGSGGEVSSYEDWLRLLPRDAHLPLEHKIATLLKQIPHVLEESGHQLFEVGLDFGFDLDGKLWLLEVNSKPGRKVILSSFPHIKDKLAKAPIEYCLYLAGKRKGVGV